MTYTLVLQILITLGNNATLTTQAYIPDLPSIESCEYIASLIEAEHICVPSKIENKKDNWSKYANM